MQTDLTKIPEPKKTAKPRAGAPSADEPVHEKPSGAGVPLFLKGQALTVGAANDPLEREADNVAETITRGGTHRTHQMSIQRRAAGNHAQVEVPPSVGEVLATPGLPLDHSARRSMEPGFGRDFEQVRIHNDARAADSAQEVNALAYTVGDHIVFGAGQYAPGTPSGDRLLAHELTHTVQQTGSNLSVQRQNPPGTQTQQPQPAPHVASGSALTDLEFILTNPRLETDPGIHAAIQLLQGYAPTVDLNRVDFRILDEANRAMFLSSSLIEDGTSHWEGSIPVIELPASMLEIATRHLAGTATVTEVHKMIRTVGHEMFHLTRTKTGNPSNPIQPVYEAEARRRMEGVHQNWLNSVQNNTHVRSSLGIPVNLQITRWEDIPAAARQQIESGATQTDFIQGFFERTAYLVEEIYVRIEELSFLRVQQHNEPSGGGPSTGEIREIARLIYFFNNLLESAAQSGDTTITPQLLRQTHAAILTQLRRRYPNRGNPSSDSYEVIFYLSAINGGLPPLYGSTGHLVSAAPPGARVP